MPKVSHIREKIVKYINKNPLKSGYSPKFFANKNFTPDVHYCRTLMIELSEHKKLIRRKYKAKNGQMTYRFFSVGQYSGDVPLGMSNFISPSVFSNNNVEPNIESVINSRQWRKFVKKTKVHLILGD